MKKYRINEIFYSLQGEGIHTGTSNVFIRFAGCNLQCDMEPGLKSPGGFVCDTDFKYGVWMTADEILQEIVRLAPKCFRVILTGGEPALQVDRTLLQAMHNRDYHVAIETNGTIELPKWPGCEEDRSLYAHMIDWITLSPKVPYAHLKQRVANEVKYVMTAGQSLPEMEVRAEYYLLSPAFDGNEIDKAAVDWCIQLVKENTIWRLSTQDHKIWGIR